MINESISIDPVLFLSLSDHEHTALAKHTTQWFKYLLLFVRPEEV